MEKKISVLADGTKIDRIFEDDRLEQQRIDAINVLGTKWLLHPANATKRLKKPFNADDIFTKKVAEQRKRLAKKFKVQYGT